VPVNSIGNKGGGSEIPGKVTGLFIRELENVM